MRGSLVTPSDIVKIAKLANIPVIESQTKELTKQVGVTIEYVSKLQELPTEGVVETSQVTGLENVVREDIVDTKRMLTQEEALLNAPHTHNGFFVVDAVLEEHE